MGSERKALFFDIDGTISDFDGTVSPLTVEALKLAKEKGHYLFVCTGRPKCHVDLSLLPGEYDGMISCAGALVEYQGKTIKDLVIPKKDLIRLDDILKKEGIYYLVQCADRVAYEEADEQKIREAMVARRMFSLPPELAEVLERGNMTVKSYRDMKTPRRSCILVPNFRWTNWRRFWDRILASLFPAWSRRERPKARSPFRP